MATETKVTHTPGPWHVNAIKDGRVIGDETAMGFDKLQINNSNATVATVYRAKDARLIAASPAMLEALEEALEGTIQPLATLPCERKDGHCSMIPVLPCRPCEARHRVILARAAIRAARGEAAS